MPDPRVAFALCAGLLLLMTVPGFVMYRAMLAHLREAHPAVWERLGRPGVVFYASMADRRALNRFVEEGEFETLGDPDFARRCRRYRAYAKTYGAVFVALWILFAVIAALRLAG